MFLRYVFAPKPFRWFFFFTFAGLLVLLGVNGALDLGIGALEGEEEAPSVWVYVGELTIGGAIFGFMVVGVIRRFREWHSGDLDPDRVYDAENPGWTLGSWGDDS